MPRHRIFDTSFASIHPHYVAKAERRNHGKDEVDQVICWLTGYDDAGLERVVAGGKKMTSVLRGSTADAQSSRVDPIPAASAKHQATVSKLP